MIGIQLPEKYKENFETWKLSFSGKGGKNEGKEKGMVERRIRRMEGGEARKEGKKNERKGK
jgi:hypothetical protein